MALCARRHKVSVGWTDSFWKRGREGACRGDVWGRWCGCGCGGWEGGGAFDVGRTVVVLTARAAWLCIAGRGDLVKVLAVYGVIG